MKPQPSRSRDFAALNTWTHDEIDAAFQAHGDLNVGLILGPRSGLIDIEIDGPDGDAALLDLFDGDVPVTPMWRSARGPHRLFEWHDDLEQVGKSSVTLGPLEIRLGAHGKGAQSLLPPSTTDGWGRRWSVSLEECSPAPLPGAVLERILASFGGHDCVGVEVGSEAEVRHSIVGVGRGSGGMRHSSEVVEGGDGKVRHGIAVLACELSLLFHLRHWFLTARELINIGMHP